MYPLQVEIDEKSVQKLTKLYETAYKSIYDEIATATDFGVANRKQILAQIKHTLGELGADTSKLIESELPKQYETGADDAIKQLNNIGAPISVDTGFNLVHKRAINALVSDTATSFGDSLTTVARNSQKLLTVVSREVITQQLATGIISGEGRKEASQRIKGILQEQGISALTDAGGKKWTLDRYAEMLYRTKLVESRNLGLINRTVENGYDLVQVSAHGAKCKLCSPWEGKILSATGNTPGYPKLQSALDAGLFHPNCRHAINTIIPSLARLTKAYDPDTPTETISNDVIKKKTNVTNPTTRGKVEVITSPSGVQLYKPTSNNDIKKMSESVRYNAAMQLDGLRSGIGGADPIDKTISKDLIVAINDINIANAKTPTEAAELIIKGLPSRYLNNPIVESTIRQWGKQMQIVFNAKGLADRGSATQTAVKVYRATGGGLGTGKQVLGDGLYVATSKENVAKYGNKITQYTLSPSAKMLDLRDTGALTAFTNDAITAYQDEYFDLLTKSGADKALGTVMKKHALRLGYDGIRGDDAAFGMVIFNSNLVKPI